MSVEQLEAGVDGLNIDQLPLLFNAPDPAVFENVPRYLFRVYSPKSDGYDDHIWAKSKASKDSQSSAGEDIFALDSSVAADILNQHLRWWGHEEDNLVSWTSSLLFAIQYIFYRRQCNGEEKDFAKIKLCIIDTTKFDIGTFIRDLDIIDLFRAYPVSGRYNLRQLANLRRGGYYFGEFLSQGALRIAGKSSVISAEQLIHGDKLYCLRGEWRDCLNPPDQNGIEWANEVLSLRGVFAGGKQKVHPSEVEAAIDIAQNFGAGWVLPVVANLLALRPRKRNDIEMRNLFDMSFCSGIPP